MDDFDNLCNLFAQVDKFHAELIPEIFQEFPGPARPRDYLQRFVDNDDAEIIVVEHEDEIVGFITLKKTDYPSYPIFRRHPHVMITTLVVDKSHRRQGVGSILMQAAQDWTRRHGVRYIQATVWTANTTATDFYSKHAFNTLNQRLEIEIDMGES
jgi:ribosomal protein S18 acetylase RimI-like enzyme